VAAPALTREDIGAAVRATLGAGAALPDEARVVAVYLFGSYARGTAGEHSDVDLGLLYAAPPPSTLLAQPFSIEAQLAEQLGRPVQCVVMNTAPADLVHRILADGTLLVVSAPSLRIRFEVDARNRYFDVKPMLDRYRRAKNVA
jgi:uncharacterized protein